MRAWSLYDWANSAFAVVVLAAVLPTYFVDVAGTSLESPETAAAYWAIIIAISLALVALLAPIVGTISDVMRGKKYLLAFFTLIGVAATGSLFFVSTGDWQLAGALFIVGRIGFGLANVFYDSLLPHTAVEEDQDRVSTRGYAMGYLGGGLLLIIAVALILTLPDEDNLGVRVAFLAVAAWWAIFSIPILRRLPEPPAAAAKLARGKSVVGTSFGRLRTTFANIRSYRQLTRFLLAFLLYDNGIGTVIALAVVYGSELGFGTLELVGALVLVQFVGIPFTLMFGSVTDRESTKRGRILTFLLVNIVAVPALGIAAAQTLDGDAVGRPDPGFNTVGGFVGEDVYSSTDSAFTRTGDWRVIGKDALPPGARSDYLAAATPGSRLDIPFNGQRITLKHSEGADHGIWEVQIDGAPLFEDGEPVIIDAYRPTVRFEVLEEFEADTEGTHTLSLVTTTQTNPAAIGSVIAIGRVEVLPPVRTSDLGVILGLLAAVVVAGAALALLLGRSMNRLAARLNTKRTILLTLVVYTGIAIWGYFLDTVIEFWFLAWAVAIVQGGSQALSRSLYSNLAPASQSGEFFGFFTAVARFGAVIGPLLFASAVAIFGNSRPAVASLAVLFVLGGMVLARVDVEEGRTAAAYHDLTALSYPRHVEGGLADYGRPESLPETAQGFRNRIRSLDRAEVAGAGDDQEV
ncbi:MAG: MFS transporter [Acidimicrobiia bacterium]